MSDNEGRADRNEVDVEVFTARELTVAAIERAIANRLSFKVVAIEDMGALVNIVEGQIEKQKLSCRVYLEYRAAALGVGLSPFGAGWGQLVAAVAGIGMGIHNLATFSPDYEIAKNPLKAYVLVTYKKSVK